MNTKKDSYIDDDALVSLIRKININKDEVKSKPNPEPNIDPNPELNIEPKQVPKPEPKPEPKLEKEEGEVSDNENEKEEGEVSEEEIEKINLPIYKNEQQLKEVLQTLENETLEIFAKFMNKTYTIVDCNIVGNLMEDIIYAKIKEKLDDFEEGPKQASPDFYGDNKNCEFELKVFGNDPNFDISNFQSYIEQLCSPNGVFKKLFKTKYIIFEYIQEKQNFKIKKFYYMNVWNLVSYNGKWPVSMQVKKSVWYNIRPSNIKEWSSPNKTSDKFIEQIIKCITNCNQNTDKEIKIKNIKDQYRQIKLKYNI
jgi:hypothetical protein